MPHGCIPKVAQEELNGPHVQDLSTQFAVSFSVCFAHSMHQLHASWQAAMRPQTSNAVVEVDWDSDSECSEFNDTSSISSFEVLDDVAVNQLCVDNITDNIKQPYSKAGKKKSRKSKPKREATSNKTTKDLTADTLPEGVWFTQTSKRGVRLATTEDIGPNRRT
uniref:Uncharacterized protein n=1 Tax=Eutreptiella gymnastica TaxID=73025 RepID=A0A6U7VXT1_9EUGL